MSGERILGAPGFVEFSGGGEEELDLGGGEGGDEAATKGVLDVMRGGEGRCGGGGAGKGLRCNCGSISVREVPAAGWCVQALARPVKRVSRSVQLRRGLVCDIVECGGVWRSGGAGVLTEGVVGVLYSKPNKDKASEARVPACTTGSAHMRAGAVIIIRGLCIALHKHYSEVINLIHKRFAGRRSAF